MTKARKYITLVRGQLKADNLEDNRKAHDMIFEPLKELGVSLGAVGHKAFINPQNPKEFLGLDTWKSLDGAQKLFGDPILVEQFQKLFEGMPDISFWDETEWASFNDET